MTTDPFRESQTDVAAGLPGAGYIRTGIGGSGIVPLLRGGTLQISTSEDGMTVEWPFVTGTLGAQPVVLLMAYKPAAKACLALMTANAR